MVRHVREKVEHPEGEDPHPSVEEPLASNGEDDAPHAGRVPHRLLLSGVDVRS